MATIAKHGTDYYSNINQAPINYQKASESYLAAKKYLLAVTIRMTSGGTPTLALAGTNLSFSLLGVTSYLYAGSTREITWLYEVTPSADTTTAIDIDAAVGDGANCTAAMFEVTDPRATTPFLNTVVASDATDTSDAPTVTLAALQGTDSLVFFWVNWQSATYTLSVSADGLTALAGRAGGETPNTGGGYKVNETTPAGVLSTAVKWAAIGVEIPAAGTTHYDVTTLTIGSTVG